MPQPRAPLEVPTVPTLALIAAYLLCLALSGHPVLIVAQLAALCGPLFGLVALARLLSPRLEVPA